MDGYLVQCWMGIWCSVGWVFGAVLDGYLIFAEKTRTGYVEINSGTGS